MVALEGHVAADANETKHRDRLLQFLASDAAHYLRSNLAGHLTASALVLNHAGDSVLLLHHRKLDPWLQPGGHADGDENLERVARKEVEEETGIGDLTLVNTGIFDVDVHTIPERKGVPEHLHYDLRFLFWASPGAVPLGNHEVKAVRWVPRSGVEEWVSDESILRMVRKADHYQ